MRVSNLQKKIIKSLNEPNEEGYLEKNISEIVSDTGSKRQSVNRALLLMLENRMMTRRKLVGSINRNEWEYLYCLPKNLEWNIRLEGEHKDIERMKNAEAVKHGFKDWRDMFIKTKF